VKQTLLLLALLAIASPAAAADIPDFDMKNAPSSVRDAKNPKARELWRDVLDTSKKNGRLMFRNTAALTKIPESKMTGRDWDCLFWRVAASFAKALRRQEPGLQPPTFADEVEAIAQRCDDDGGPGSLGVRVYNTAIMKMMKERGEANRSATPSEEAIRFFLAFGVVIGESSKAAAAAAAKGVVPILVFPQEMVDDLRDGEKGPITF